MIFSIFSMASFFSDHFPSDKSFKYIFIFFEISIGPDAWIFIIDSLIVVSPFNFLSFLEFLFIIFLFD